MSTEARFVNLTPHTVNIVNGPTFPPSGSDLIIWNFIMSNRINPFGSDSFSRIDGPPPPFVGSERVLSEFGGGSAAGAVIEDSPAPPLRFRPQVRTRFDVTLNEKLAKDFEELALSEGVSRAEIFKRAMAAYKIIKQIQNSGAKIVVQRDGQLDRELIAI